MTNVRVIGGGLAGCEAALVLANNGIKVDLFEMKPHKKTPAQKLEGLAELVCSNSFRSNKGTNAVGLLKDEMLLLDGNLIGCALQARVPAGDSLAVDREQFSLLVERKVKNNPNITIHYTEITSLPLDGIPTVVATGPLTSDMLAASIAKTIGHSELAFYDAIAPIIDADSIDMNHAFIKSRWQKEGEEGDFINCPLSKEEYETFVKELNQAEQFAAHAFEDAKYFEGCLPIEVMANRGIETLRFGPFKPVGLFEKNEVRAHAVLQLRKEDIHGQSYNLVGCQTRMTIPEQRRVFGLIPALKDANFLRFGSVHRNTYVDSPKVLDDRLRLQTSDGQKTNIHLAGQITGVEGYVESIAAGMLVAHIILDELHGRPFKPFPKETAHGGLYRHILGLDRAFNDTRYVPSNVTWAMIPPLVESVKKNEKREALYNRAISSLKEYLKDKKSFGTHEFSHETSA